MKKKIALVGVPTDVGAGHRGSSMGPEALRVAGISDRLLAMGFEVLDRGNLHGPVNPVRAPERGYRNFDEVVEWNRLTCDAIYDELKQGNLPIMLGGDHCLATGSISAVSRYVRESGKKLRVIWLDAHTDFNTSESTPSGNMHGMPVACLFGHGPKEMVELSGIVPALTSDQIYQIGIRSVDSIEKVLVHEAGHQVFDMRKLDEIGMREAMEFALDGLTDEYHLHVSFDVDFLDPEIAPGVGTTVRGGPDYREAQLCMEMIADTGLISSLDIVELNPALDVQNLTANIACELVESLFGKNTLVRQ
ncbi:arginase [Taylorella equigenitalis]|uniref:arginase n=1 Tax=Taylorella equigenitalis TaxID=29575 RepID=UPI0003F66C31|nr:arginase [Taylorella equigenitalis]WDU53355.1 arginase [Taylorella equigenitalis]